MSFSSELEQKSDVLFEAQIKKDFEILENNAEKANWKKGDAPTFQTDRLVFGQFIENRSEVRILKPTWLSGELLKKSSENYDKKPKVEVKFDFTKSLKDRLEQTIDPEKLCMFWIDDYQSRKMSFMIFRSKTEYTEEGELDIPQEWLDQWKITTERTSYTIMSKIVFPLIEKKGKNNVLWGVAFLESSKKNLRESFTIYDCEFFYTLIKRYGTLFIELGEENSDLKNLLDITSVEKERVLKENNEIRNLLNAKYSAKTLFLSSASVAIALFFAIFAWFSLHISIIHPILSLPLFVGSVGFSFLSYWRMK